MARISMGVNDKWTLAKPKPAPTPTASPELKALSVANAPQSAVPNTDVPVSVMEGQTPLAIPPVLPDTTSTAGVVATGQAVIDQEQKRAQQELANAEQPITESEARIRELMGLQAGKSATQAKLAEQTGLNDASQLTRDLIERIRLQTEALAEFDDDTAFNEEQMRLQAAGKDITKGTFSAMSAEMNLQRALDRRARASQVRATTGAYYAAQGQYELAKEQVEQSMALIYEPIEQELEMEKFFLERNDAKLSAAQKGVADARNLAISYQLDSISAAKALTLDAISSGYATPQEIERLNSLNGDPEAQSDYALGIIGRGSAEDRALQRMNTISTMNARTEPIPSDIDLGTIPTLPDGSPDLTSPEYMTQLLTSSGQYKENPTQSEREDLNKFSNVIGQTGALITSLSETETGPIIGYLKSLNPYDFDARAVNAQLQALVPSVARGVYGEVGVLTDADIRNYLQTLPNLKSTAEQNRFVASMTLKNAQRSFEQTLRGLANSKVDVSGWVNDYNAISRQVRDLESQIGSSVSDEALEKEFNALDAGVRAQGGGALSSLGQLLFGTK